MSPEQVHQPRVTTVFLAGLVTVITMLTPGFVKSASGLDSVDCVIYPSKEANVGTASVGVLESLLVERSDVVKEGDALAQLESSTQQAAVALATARAEAAAEVTFRQLSADHSKRQLSRIEQLVEKDSASAKEFDDRKTEAQLGEQQLKKAIENKKILALELASAKVALDKRTVVSPFSGVVVETYKAAGEYINADPIVRVVQLDPLYIETILPAEKIGSIQPGMNAHIVPADNGGNRWTAQVDRVDSVVDVASGTFGVRLTLPNPDFAIAAGLRCKVSFMTGTDEPVLGAAMPIIGDSPTVANDGDALAQKTQSCLFGGPYDTELEAQEKVAMAQRAGDVVEIVTRQVKEPRGYFLVSEEFDSVDAANSYLVKLESEGLTDSFLLSQSTPARVSIGAFQKVEKAEQTKRALSLKGMESEVVRWEKSQDKYFLVEKRSLHSQAMDCEPPLGEQ